MTTFKLNLGYEELDAFDLEILDHRKEVVTMGGGPFVVRLYSPKSDKIKAVYRRQADEFSRWLERFPVHQRDDLNKPDDMAKRHGFEVLQAAHASWQNPPLFDDSGNLLPADSLQFDSSDFLKFLEDNEAYSAQVMRGLASEKNYQRAAE